MSKPSPAYLACMVTTPSTPAHLEYMVTTPSTPAHLEYMARAKARYPRLPPGAAQTALCILEWDGAKAAAGYAARAGGRWRVDGFVFVMPKRTTRGICKHSIKERDERLARYRAHMAEGAENLERPRKAAGKKPAAALAAVTPMTPRQAAQFA